MTSEHLTLLKPTDISADLQVILAANSAVDMQNLQVAMVVNSDENGQLKSSLRSRHEIILTSMDSNFAWHVDSLREMFRGDCATPTKQQVQDEYVACIYILERHALIYAKSLGAPSDQAMREIYSLLRRRPDGRSEGPLHDFMWQVAAFMLAKHALSCAEYEAILNRLERSCKTFSMGVSSHNYMDVLDSMFESQIEITGRGVGA